MVLAEMQGWMAPQAELLPLLLALLHCQPSVADLDSRVVQTPHVEEAVGVAEQVLLV